MRVRYASVDLHAGDYAEIEGGDVRVYNNAEAVVLNGHVTIFEGGRAIIVGCQLGGDGTVKAGGKVWVCKEGMARVCRGAEGFAVVGSCVTVEPGGMLHMFDEEEWEEAAARTWGAAGGQASTFYLGE